MIDECKCHTSPIVLHACGRTKNASAAMTKALYDINEADLDTLPNIDLYT